ncbi:TonB-dependent receptor domain-containing protein [Marinifilum caeruleilacunae]|uniref:TonB-dependent receptor n=1 Tax=Marinifilum caeruleilacunae TaxID=2499076 RepID=A0ABX1WV42_9BACT|nr:TonB-dependent receptor [Marinifilum caeruleilacunae]NOU59952.1 TonB-dependent receptor [Marinifilum caeruleilacunae]
MNKLTLLLGFLCLAIFAKAVEPVVKPELQGGVIKGVVKDQALEAPVEYATVSVYTMADSTLIDGTITDAKGAFELKKLKPGSYFVEVSFIGYNKAAVRNIPINKKRKVIDLKTVSLRQSTEALDEVTVTTERIPVQYQIDKKVIPVSRQITAASGNAVDVLENVPSVTVDIEGNVSLRGSSNFTVLVDGKPSILDAADILEQMPASMIENIEIITNPSAKYDPEGTAGIINVITKKNKESGLTGVVNVNLGSHENNSADFLLNYRKKKWNFNFGLDYSRRGFKGSSESENRTEIQGTTNYLLSSGDTERHRDGYGFKTGVDYDINDKNQLSFAFRYGTRDMERKSFLDYEEYAEGEPSVFYDSRDQWNREMNFVNSSLSYTKKFEGKGHQWYSQVSFSRRTSGDEESINARFDDAGNQISGQRSTEEGPGQRIEIRSDYTLPMGEERKLEFGYQGQIRSSEADTKRFEYNTSTNLYDYQEQYSNDVTYDRSVHGLYATFADKAGILGYQVGFRTEHTNREVDYSGEAEKFKINRWDFFPTIHAQLDLGSRNQLMASYTRRIDRPRGYYLEPFITWTDAYNVRQGNPDLDPEYIDSYELGYMKRFGDQAISVESYYKVTHNKVERIRTVYDENVMLSSVANVGKDYSLGIEATLNLSFAKWFKNDLIGNIYHYKEEGSFETENALGEIVAQDFSTESFNWSIRNNSTIIFDKSTRLQMNINYRSPTDWAQGERAGFLTTSIALRKDFFKRKLSATFQVRDVLGTFKHEVEYMGDGFYNFNQFEMDSPVFRLNLSYKINNYKQKRGRRSVNGVDVEEFEM